jgi:hypothetical protein
VYWPCGIHVCGAALDDGDDVDGFTGKMLVDAVRDGSKVEYRKGQDVLSVALQKCTCSELETALEQCHCDTAVESMDDDNTCANCGRAFLNRGREHD